MAPTLYHATTAANVKSIRRHGLLCRLARGKRRAVWLCTRGMVDWAIAHVVRKHRCPPSAVRVLAVRPPVEVKGSRVPGLLYTTADVPPQQISAVEGRAKVEWRVAT